MDYSSFEEFEKKDNKISKRFNDLLKRKDRKRSYRLFYNIPKEIRKIIFENLSEINKTSLIDFNKYLPTGEYQAFFNTNTKIITNRVCKLENLQGGILIQKLFKQVDILKQTGSSTFAEGGKIDTREVEPENIETIYPTAVIDDEEYYHFKPNHDFSYNDLLMNYFKFGAKIKYMFKQDIALRKMTETESTLQRNSIEIMGFIDMLAIPIKYEIKCTARDKYNQECGNIINFCEAHKHSNIFCTDSLGDREVKNRHAIKKIDTAVSKELKNLYTYNARDMNSDGEKNETLIIVSTEEITDSIIESNGFFIADAGANTSVYYLISYKPKTSTTIELKGKILQKDRQKNYFFLHDMFESLKKYYTKYHKLPINNSNKIVGETILLQLLNNRYLDYISKSLVLGTSGSGKSFYTKVLPQLFTNKIQTIMGESVTRTMLLGGRSNVLSKRFNSPYSPGYVSTNDMLVLEESAGGLNKIASSKAGGRGLQDLGFNVVSALKNVGNKYEMFNPGIQGSKDTMSMANIVMLGNITNLHTPLQEYEKHLVRVYKTITKGKMYSKKHPLFRPIEYYKELDINLAKAHQIIRQQFYNSKNYVTHLDEAEQSRFAIFILLDNSGGQTTEELIDEAANGTDFRPLKTQPHKTEFLKELDEAFLKDGDPLLEAPTDFKKSIRRFMAEYFYREPNNFVPEAPLGKEGGNKINTHLFNAQTALMTNMLYLNKLYWGDEIIFTDDDKNLIRYYESYNYNSLNSKEATMGKRPLINNHILDDKKIDKEYDDQKEAYNTGKMIERKMQDKASLKVDLKKVENVLGPQKDVEEDIFNQA